MVKPETGFSAKVYFRHMHAAKEKRHIAKGLRKRWRKVCDRIEHKSSGFRQPLCWVSKQANLIQSIENILILGICIYIYVMINGIQDRPLFFFPLQDMVAPETAKSGRLHPQNFQNSLVELWFRLTLSLVSPIIIHITVIVTNRTVLIKHHIDAWTSIEPLSTTVIKNH